VSLRQPQRRVQALQMFLFSMLAAAVFVGLYLIFVKTAPGQRFDDIAFEGRKATRLAVRRPVTFAVRLLTVPFVVLGCMVIAVDTVRRGWWRTGAAALGSVALTILLARSLKGDLVRPELINLAYASSRNSFPSGHIAAVMAVLLAALSACEEWVRSALAALGAFGTAAATAALLGSGWHRPSDVLAGLALAVVVVSLTTSLRLLVLQGPSSASTSNNASTANNASTSNNASTASSASMPWSLYDRLGVDEKHKGLVPVWATALVAISAIAFLVLFQNPSANPSHSLLSYMLVVVVCSSLGMGAVFVFAHILSPQKALSAQETKTGRQYR